MHWIKFCQIFFGIPKVFILESFNKDEPFLDKFKHSQNILKMQKGIIISRKSKKDKHSPTKHYTEN